MAIIQGDFGSKKEKKKIPIYQFHISLAFSDPLIWRRVRVPGNLTLKQFHEVIELCFGWSGENNHQFYVGKVFYEMSSTSGEKREYDEACYTLGQLDEPMKWCFTYIYDAGDGWEHDITLESVEEGSVTAIKPELLEGEWASPPEDIGSVHSYEEFLTALESPKEVKNQAILAHHGIDAFDPASFDLDQVNEQLMALDMSA